MFLSETDLYVAFVLFFVYQAIRRLILVITSPVWLPIALLTVFAIAVWNDYRSEKPDGHNFCQQETN